MTANHQADEPVQLLSSFPVGSVGDQALRKALSSLRSHADPTTARIIDGVLSGKRPLRDILDSQWTQQQAARLRNSPELNTQLARRIAELQEEGIDPEFLTKKAESGDSRKQQ